MIVAKISDDLWLGGEKRIELGNIEPSHVEIIAEHHAVVSIAVRIIQVITYEPPHIEKKKRMILWRFS